MRFHFPASMLSGKQTAHLLNPLLPLKPKQEIYTAHCVLLRKKERKIPVALIIAGSGPTDRNGNNTMGLQTDVYKMLAHALSAYGIATVRYDKRGIGASKAAMKSESDLRFDTYIDDAKDWVKLLKADKRFSGIIIIGHSEGSLIGTNASVKNVNKFISLAGVAKA